MNLEEANKLWYNLKPIESVLFGYNDDVCIISGKYAGESATIISLESLEPVTYLVELASGGGDIIITELELEKSE
ncbi:MAG: hypothetical protein M3367_08495 [Acidobacteriota bacterium]|nr:hypothetical protein [Acidobacteriota bacterium]